MDSVYCDRSTNDPPFGVGPARILLAEDNPALAQVTKFSLERGGFEVVAARDGWEAWTALEQGKFDAVVSDEQMPRMTGRELCARMRASEAHRGLPMILLTAKCLEVDHGLLESELGIAKVVGKPFSPRELVRIVEQVLLAVPKSG